MVARAAGVVGGNSVVMVSPSLGIEVGWCFVLCSGFYCGAELWGLLVDSGQQISAI